MSSPPPTVTVLLAVRDGEAYVRVAVESVLRQTVGDLELLVVDDCSQDRTPELLAAVADPRLVVLRNEEHLGLAASLNRGLDRASARYVARLDADDVALPRRLERQLERMRAVDGLGVLGTAALDLDDVGRVGALQLPPAGAAAVRWHGLFTSPFLHPTVLLDRELLDRHGLRYDPGFDESEDYDLWMRLLAVAEGDNLGDPLVLRRVHPAQASLRRRGLQRGLQRRVALRELARVAPGLAEDEAELAWLLGSGEGVPAAERERAADAYLAVLERFRATLPAGADLGPARAAAARVLLRAGLVARSLELDRLLPADVAVRCARRVATAVPARREARRVLAALEDATGDGDRVRVTIVSPEPTPFRSILFDRLAQRPELDLRVVYSAYTIFGRWWTIVPTHRATFLEGTRIPGVRNVFRHDYPLTFGIVRALADTRPDVVVVAGWSTFAAQAAVAWCRARRVPYVLLVESNDADPRPGWRRAVKGAVVPPFVRGAERVLYIGTLAHESVLARGADPARIAWFANTVDAPAFAAETERLQPRRPELRAALGAGADDVVVLSIARLAPEKGLDTLVRAVAAAGDPRLLLVLAGDGPEREALEALARELGVRLAVVENIPFDRIVERYVPADVFALLSTHEPWGVVVNEAAACGLPLVLTDRVGAHADLLADGENGMLVPAGDAAAAGEALRRLAADPELRRRYGERSLELMRGWGYEPSIESFVATVRAAAAR
ncbi:MAG TPA: glycosyltransferase [Gaiellaceae bacterium]|nr:glycosyltransferase [Gaiellaceae bacterium]